MAKQEDNKLNGLIKIYDDLLRRFLNSGSQNVNTNKYSPDACLLQILTNQCAAMLSFLNDYNISVTRDEKTGNITFKYPNKPSVKKSIPDNSDDKSSKEGDQESDVKNDWNGVDVNDKESNIKNVNDGVDDKGKLLTNMFVDMIVNDNFNDIVEYGDHDEDHNQYNIIDSEGSLDLDLWEPNENDDDNDDNTEIDPSEVNKNDDNDIKTNDDLVDYYPTKSKHIDISNNSSSSDQEDSDDSRYQYNENSNSHELEDYELDDNEPDDIQEDVDSSKIELEDQLNHRNMDDEDLTIIRDVEVSNIELRDGIIDFMKDIIGLFTIWNNNDNRDDKVKNGDNVIRDDKAKDDGKNLEKGSMRKNRDNVNINVPGGNEQQPNANDGVREDKLERELIEMGNDDIYYDEVKNDLDHIRENVQNVDNDENDIIVNVKDVDNELKDEFDKKRNIVRIEQPNEDSNNESESNQDTDDGDEFIDNESIEVVNEDENSDINSQEDFHDKIDKVVDGSLISDDEELKYNDRNENKLNKPPQQNIFNNINLNPQEGDINNNGGIDNPQEGNANNNVAESIKYVIDDSNDSNVSNSTSSSSGSKSSINEENNDGNNGNLYDVYVNIDSDESESAALGSSTSTSSSQSLTNPIDQLSDDEDHLEEVRRFYIKVCNNVDKSVNVLKKLCERVINGTMEMNDAKRYVNDAANNTDKLIKRIDSFNVKELIKLHNHTKDKLNYLFNLYKRVYDALTNNKRVNDNIKFKITSTVKSSLSGINDDNFLSVFDRCVSRNLKLNGIVKDGIMTIKLLSYKKTVNEYFMTISSPHVINIILLKQQVDISNSLKDVDQKTLSRFDEIVRHGFTLRNINDGSVNNLYCLLVSLTSCGVEIKSRSTILDEFWNLFKECPNYNIDDHRMDSLNLTRPLRESICKLLKELKNSYNDLTPSDLLSCTVHDFVLKYYLFRMFYCYVRYTIYLNQLHSSNDDLYRLTLKCIINELVKMDVHTIVSNTIYGYDTIKLHIPSTPYIGFIQYDITDKLNDIGYVLNMPDVGILICDNHLINEIGQHHKQGTYMKKTDYCDYIIYSSTFMSRLLIYDNVNNINLSNFFK